MLCDSEGYKLMGIVQSPLNGTQIQKPRPLLNVIRNDTGIHVEFHFSEQVLLHIVTVSRELSEINFLLVDEFYHINNTPLHVSIFVF